MDFAKYVSMPSQKALYFCPARDLEDQFEGAYGRCVGAVTLHDIRSRADVKLIRLARRRADRMRDETTVNSWSLGKSESAAMWGLYLGSGLGIAVRSTVGRLCDSLSDLDTEPLF
jgi:hypothetical protein